jgi:anti-sigma factor RsiW
MIVSRPNPGPCQGSQLERLRRDELSDEQALALAHHLEQCPICQQLLDQTVELDTAWNQARSSCDAAARSKSRRCSDRFRIPRMVATL